MCGSFAGEQKLVDLLDSRVDIRPRKLNGNSPFAMEERNNEGLLPAMTLASEIMAIRDVAAGDGVGYGLDWVAQKQSRVGIISIGYGDGYPRHAPAALNVLTTPHHSWAEPYKIKMEV